MNAQYGRSHLPKLWRRLSVEKHKSSFTLVSRSFSHSSPSFTCQIVHMEADKSGSVAQSSPGPPFPAPLIAGEHQRSPALLCAESAGRTELSTRLLSGNTKSQRVEVDQQEDIRENRRTASL